MRMLTLEGWAIMLVASLPANATTVYKCEDSGTVTFTDQPCAADATPYELPWAAVLAEPTAPERELAREHDRRLARDRQERDRADAAWLEQHRGQTDRAERVRQAMIERRVIRGMTMDEVKRALGFPDRRQKSESHGSEKETWVYSDYGATRRVNFKNGEVTTTSRRERETGWR